MALTLPPDASANSYASAAFGNSYFADFPDSLITAWVDAPSDTEREQALIAATRILDVYDWVGKKVHTLADNALRWPRSGVYDPDGEALDSSTVPVDIQRAACELANALLAGDVDASGNSTASSTTQSTKSIAIDGAISISYDNSVSAKAAFNTPVGNIVSALIKPYVRGGMSRATARLIRG